jgi:cytochrome c oxidase subunit II
MDTSFRMFPDAASTMADQVDLFYFFMWAVTGFFTLLIFVLVVGFALKYRRRSEEPPPEQPTYVKLEMLWTVIPFAITMVMFVWGAYLAVAQSRIPENATTIDVLGKQWMWKTQHPNGRQEINELTVPVNRPIKLRMISQDVIHSFFIPAFRNKQDVLPGRYSYMWFQATKPGTYHLFCAEYCGAQHAGMVGRVNVLSEAEYERWLEAVPPEDELAETAGFKLYTQYGCQLCHGARAPTLAGLYGREETVIVDGQERKVMADVEYLRESILYPRAKLVKGFHQGLDANAMPSYANQLNEEQLQLLIAYIKSLSPAGRNVQGGEGPRMDPGQKMQELRPVPPDLSESTAEPRAR